MCCSVQSPSAINKKMYRNCYANSICYCLTLRNTNEIWGTAVSYYSIDLKKTPWFISHHLHQDRCTVRWRNLFWITHLYGKKACVLKFLMRYYIFCLSSTFLEFEKKILGISISLFGNKNEIVKSYESYFRKYIIIIHVINNTKFEWESIQQWIYNPK